MRREFRCDLQLVERSGCAGPFLTEFWRQCLDVFAPIDADFIGQWRFAENIGAFFGETPQDIGIGVRWTTEAGLDFPIVKRPDCVPANTDHRLGDIGLYPCIRVVHQLVDSGKRLGVDDDLRIRGVGILGANRQIESRRPLADECANRCRRIVLLDKLLDQPQVGIRLLDSRLRWDLLNYGRLLNNIDVQDARFQELAYSYQDRVLNAGREVEDALIAFLKSQQQVENLTASAHAAARTVDISTEAYQEGASNYLSVYLFESVLGQQQDQLAATRGEIALNLIQVYRALGGGWQIRLTPSDSHGFLALDAADENPVPVEEVPLPLPSVVPLPPTD